MKFRKMFTIIFGLLSVLSFTAGKDFYYWRDYYGDITPDALESGTDANGNPTYIGTSYFHAKYHLFPTTITKGDLSAYVIAGKEKWVVRGKTKILCSTNNTLFRWIPTDTKKVRYLTGCQQIEGGWSGETLITIGRANHQGRTLTGRVYDSATNNRHGLWIHDATPQVAILTEYEVLTFNCENPYIEEVDGSINK